MSKRLANLPRSVRALAAKTSKADLLEVAWSLASLCNEAGSCDDETSTFDRLVEEVRALAARPPTEKKIAELRERFLAEQASPSSSQTNETTGDKR